MVVRIRLARHGTRNNPFYHIVAIRDKAAREARPIEKLGEFDPIPRPRQPSTEPIQAWDGVGVAAQSAKKREDLDKPVFTSGIEQSTPVEKRIEWNVSRIQHWLSVGAQPSKPVARLLNRAGLIPEGKWYKGIYRPPAEVEAAQAKYLQEKQEKKVKILEAVQKAGESSMSTPPRSSLSTTAKAAVAEATKGDAQTLSSNAR